MTLTASEIIKNKVSDETNVLPEKDVTIIRDWLEEQVSDVVMKSAYKFKQFLNNIPDIQSNDEYNKAVLVTETFIYQDDVCNLIYHYKPAKLSIDLLKNAPLEVVRSIKVCTLIDFNKLTEELADLEFSIKAGKNVYVDTKFKLTGINGYYESGFDIRLTEVTTESE